MTAEKKLEKAEVDRIRAKRKRVQADIQRSRKKAKGLSIDDVMKVCAEKHISYGKAVAYLEAENDAVHGSHQ